MKEFKNIPSKLFEKTENWVEKEKTATKIKFGDFNNKNPMPRRPMSASTQTRGGGAPRLTSGFRIQDPKPKVSMFDEYYHDKLVEKKIIPGPEEEDIERQKELLDDQFEEHLRELRAFNNIESQLNEQYENIKKVQLKANTPSINDKGLILEKTDKNFIEENKQIINNGQIKSKIKPVKSMENPFHKEYGKTPKYIQNMRIEAEAKKELDELKKEEAKYPKGTRLLSEEERLFTLNKLVESKKDIEQLIAKLPITLASQAAKNKQEELFKKLDEIENAICTFSRKKVFVKINA